MESDPAAYARLEQLFHAAAALEGEARRVFAAEATVGDPALRAELDRLLANLEDLSGFLEEPLDLEGLTAAASPPIEVPERIGPFRLLEELGSGGMGVVYLAEQDHPRRRVALKVLRWDLGRASLTRRFEREVRALGRLDHPGLARILGAGHLETPRGPLPWYAMRYVRGQSLEAAAAGLDERGLARLFATLCEALECAHREGVVHRDLKPGNVLIDGAGQPVLLDFGVAALRDDTAPGPRTLTGQLLGTLAYMSPEQTRGSSVEIGPSSDVYSVGAMLYELLVGRLPVDVRGADPVEALRRIREQEPVGATSLRPELASDLETILAKALEKAPERRYRTAQALADDLRAFLEDRPIAARPQTAIYRAGKLVRRHRLLVATLCGAIACLLVGLSLSLPALARARRAERAAAASRDAALCWFDIGLLAELEARVATPPPLVPESADELDFLVRRGLELRARLPLYQLFEDLFPGRPPPSSRSGRLAQMLERAPRFFDPDRGEGGFEQLRRRGREVRELHARTVGECAPAWREAVEAIATSPAYGGLSIVPQVGLLPLGPDPDSGLWEFALWGATGSVPRRDPASGRLEFGEDSALVFVLLPGGPLRLGHQAEDPLAPRYYRAARPHEAEALEVELELAPFFISKYELTQGQWTRVRGENTSQYIALESSDSTTICRRHPVESVNWLMASEFAAQLGLRLPTEAQHEYAQRGGSETAFWSGQNFESLFGRENISGPAQPLEYFERGRPRRWSGQVPHAPAGLFDPNPFGLHDMAGNVWEWCRDTFWVHADQVEFLPGTLERVHPDPRETRANPHRSLRGGSVDSEERIHASGFRNDAIRTESSGFTGVRLVRPLDIAERGAP